MAREQKQRRSVTASGTSSKEQHQPPDDPGQALESGEPSLSGRRSLGDAAARKNAEPSRQRRSPK